MRKRKYTVLGYIAGFFLMYYFYFGAFCRTCWVVRYLNPLWISLVLSTISSFIVFLVCHEDLIRIEKYKRDKQEIKENSK